MGKGYVVHGLVIGDDHDVALATELRKQLECLDGRTRSSSVRWRELFGNTKGRALYPVAADVVNDGGVTRSQRPVPRSAPECIPGDVDPKRGPGTAPLTSNRQGRP
ncbi:hypothetical protein V502_06561 [Pseudogymnoascus sp. VKM F-4520 (FW-2644)]|nr:hypothetical protein V502_06561 [Pseudogymnoascus sp. VKM F-4520 (FW-2644)]